MDEIGSETHADREAGVHARSARDDAATEPRGRGRALSRGAGRLALSLGLLGLGLGLAELFAPRRLNRVLGVRDRRRTRAVTRALGARELAATLGLLAVRRPAPWLWGRVAGDAMDLGLLGTQLRRRDVKRGQLAGAIATVVGVAALDIFAAAKAQGRERSVQAGPVRRSITIAVTPERAYTIWRDLRNLPAFMQRIDSVEELDSRRSRWQARTPLGAGFTWEAEIVDDRPNERIRWRSVEGSEIDNQGEVRFRAAPGGRGAEVTVEIAYVPPAGELGRAASFFSNQALAVDLERDLQRLKQLLELGEVVRSDASVHTGPQPARPATREEGR